jgi:hypothetical protein
MVVARKKGEGAGVRAKGVKEREEGERMCGGEGDR